MTATCARCARCMRLLRNPIQFGGAVYGATCAARLGYVPPAAERRQKAARRAAAKHSKRAVRLDPQQPDFFAEDLQFAQRVDALLSSLSLDLTR